MVEDHHPVRDVPHHLHVVFDEHDGEPPFVTQPADESGQLGGFHGVHTGHRFVQQEEAGLGGHGPSDFQTPAVGVGECECRLVQAISGESGAEEGQDLLGSFPDFPFLLLESLGLEQRADKEL